MNRSGEKPLSSRECAQDVQDGRLVRLKADAVVRDEALRFWSRPADEVFIASIARAGQIQPGILRPEKSGFVLVSGAARLDACMELGVPFWAFVRELAPVSAINVYIEENRRRVALHREPAAAMPALGALIRSGESVDAGLALLGFPAKSKAAGLLRGRLGKPSLGRFDAAFAAGRLPFEALEQLNRMDEAAHEALEPFFETLSWSRGAATGFLRDLLEIGVRESKPVALVLEELALRAILARDLSPKDLLEFLGRTVQAARRPELARRLQASAGLRKRIEAGGPVRIDPEDAFETRRHRLTVRISSRAELAKARDSLARISQVPEWDELFDLAD